MRTWMNSLKNGKLKRRKLKGENLRTQSEKLELTELKMSSLTTWWGQLLPLSRHWEGREESKYFYHPSTFNLTPVRRLHSFSGCPERLFRKNSTWIIDEVSGTIYQSSELLFLTGTQLFHFQDDRKVWRSRVRQQSPCSSQLTPYYRHYRQTKHRQINHREQINWFIQRYRAIPLSYRCSLSSDYFLLDCSMTAALLFCNLPW